MDMKLILICASGKQVYFPEKKKKADQRSKIWYMMDKNMAPLDRTQLMWVEYKKCSNDVWNMSELASEMAIVCHAFTFAFPG